MKISSITKDNSGNVRLTINGENNSSIDVQHSSDLLNWNKLRTIIVTGDNMSIDINAFGDTKFFRLKLNN